MKSLVALASALFVTMAASEAGAVTKWKYRYEGTPLVFFGEGSNLPSGQPAVFSGYSIEFVLDESEVLGGTLRNADIDISRFGENINTEGLVSFQTYGDPPFIVDEPVGRNDWRLAIATDENRQVIIEPDREPIIRETRLNYEVYDEFFVLGGRILGSVDNYIFNSPSGLIGWEAKEPGTWTVAPIPVPAGLPLSLAGIGALGLAGWRRRQTVDG